MLRKTKAGLFAQLSILACVGALVSLIIIFFTSVHGQILCNIERVLSPGFMAFNRLAFLSIV